MERTYTYHIKYLEDSPYGEVKGRDILAPNKEEAYFRFIDKYQTVYSAWVHSVTYSNGKQRVFNNFSGNPY